MLTINKTGTVGIFVVMELTSVLDKKMFLVPFTGKSSLKDSSMETIVYKLASGHQQMSAVPAIATALCVVGSRRRPVANLSE
jgi:hypothetical protein